MKQKLHSFFLFLLLFMVQNAWGQGDATLTEIESGSLSSTVQWTLYSKDDDEFDLHLSITGTGAMPDFSSEKFPWESACPSGDRRDITSVSIADGITKIGAYAFNWLCIYSIDIPSSVTSIGAYAFSNSALKEVYIPSSVTSIGTGAFNNCNLLSLIHYDGSCTSSTGIAFSGVAKTGLFYEKWGSGTSYAQVPSGWEYKTFTGSIAYIHNGTLYVRGSGAYTTYSTNASWYSDRNYITKIVIGDGITNIGYNAFSGCSNVTELTLNNKGSIENGAFKNCTSLTRVNIGTGVTNFVGYWQTGTGETYSSYPFEGCSNLTTINISDFASFNAIGDLFYLTNSEYGTAKEKTLMVNGTTHPSTNPLVIPKGVTEINHDAICYFKNVTKINLPSTVTEIKSHNFSKCKYLTEITLPSTVTYVGYHAFEYCSGLQTVTLNNNGYVASGAFYNCTGLKTAILNNNGNVGAGAFSGCTALKTVTLNNTGTIENGAFKNCTSLTRVNIGTGVTNFVGYWQTGTGETYSSYPFEGCSNLTTINISDFASFNAIGDLFYLTNSEYGTAKEKTLMVNGTEHNADETFFIPEGVTSYNNYALRYFSNVKKVGLPTTMTTVSGFENHIYLTKISLHYSVKSVAFGAFLGCSALKRIVCNATTPPSITGSIASNPSTITVKLISSKYVSAYQAANYWKDFNIEGPRAYTENKSMYVLGTIDLKSNALTYGMPRYWTAYGNNETVVSVDDNGVVTAEDFIYDGTTSNPCKDATIIANLEDGDAYRCTVSVYPKEVELTDGNAYKNTVYYMPERITYTRTFSSNVAGKWQCFYVPFDIKITEELLENFDFAKLYMVSYMDENNNDEIDDTDPLKMMFNKLSVGKTLHANMPYFVRAKSACTKTFEVTNAALNAAENGSVRCCTTEHEYSLIGVYETTNIKGKYSMNTNGKFVYCPTDANIKGNRWYMEVKSLTEDGAEFENYAHPIEIYVDGEDETTGIVALEDKASDSKNDKVYTLDGRQVTNTNNLPSGIYIVNGKKVFKK